MTFRESSLSLTTVASHGRTFLQETPESQTLPLSDWSLWEDELDTLGLAS